jgi:large subunit ribosomal protein L29
MAIFKLKELREMKADERRKKLNELRAELLRLKAQKNSGTIENPGRIREIRKAIARILTIENEIKKGVKIEVKPR